MALSAVPHDRASAPRARGADRGGIQSAADSARGVAGQGRGEDAPLLLVAGVGLGRGAALDQLGHFGDLHGLISVDLDQGVVELVGRIDGVQDLFCGPPTLTWALLEQPERVAVAEPDVSQLRLLYRGGVGDRGGSRRQSTLPARAATIANATAIQE